MKRKRCVPPLPIRAAAKHIQLGYQSNLPVWIMGPDIQLDENGEMIHEEHKQTHTDSAWSIPC